MSFVACSGSCGGGCCVPCRGRENYDEKHNQDYCEDETKKNATHHSKYAKHATASATTLCLLPFSPPSVRTFIFLAHAPRIIACRKIDNCC